MKKLNRDELLLLLLMPLFVALPGIVILIGVVV